MSFGDVGVGRLGVDCCQLGIGQLYCCWHLGIVHVMLAGMIISAYRCCFGVASGHSVAWASGDVVLIVAKWALGNNMDSGNPLCNYLDSSGSICFDFAFKSRVQVACFRPCLRRVKSSRQPCCPCICLSVCLCNTPSVIR